MEMHVKLCRFRCVNGSLLRKTHKPKLRSCTSFGEINRVTRYVIVKYQVVQDLVLQASRHLPTDELILPFQVVAISGFFRTWFWERGVGVVWRAGIFLEMLIRFNAV